MQAFLVACFFFFLLANVAADNWVSFLEQTRRVGPQVEWNREIVARNAGVFRCRIESQAPFAVTLIADRTYRAMLRGETGQIRREDILITVDSRELVFDKTFSTPAGGSFWFILQNQSRSEVEMTLSCWNPGKS
jgi:hypothetical protein